MTGIFLTPRPLDIVIHSIVVTAEIMIARDRLIGEPDYPKVHTGSKAMFASIMASYTSVIELNNYKYLVTPHIAGILSHSMTQVNDLKSRVNRLN